MVQGMKKSDLKRAAKAGHVGHRPHDDDQTHPSGTSKYAVRHQASGRSAQATLKLLEAEEAPPVITAPRQENSAPATNGRHVVASVEPPQRVISERREAKLYALHTRELIREQLTRPINGHHPMPAPAQPATVHSDEPTGVHRDFRSPYGKTVSSYGAPGLNRTHTSRHHGTGNARRQKPRQQLQEFMPPAKNFAQACMQQAKLDNPLGFYGKRQQVFFDHLFAALNSTMVRDALSRPETAREEFPTLLGDALLRQVVAAHEDPGNTNRYDFLIRQYNVADNTYVLQDNVADVVEAFARHCLNLHAQHLATPASAPASAAR